MALLDPYQADLDRLSTADRRRILHPRIGLDFSSNDYLALAASPVLAEAAQAALARGVAIGSGGSRLLRGNHPEHEALETEAAKRFGSESALFFATGYAANVAILSTLPQKNLRQARSGPVAWSMVARCATSWLASQNIRSIAGRVVTSASPASATVPISRSMSTGESAEARLRS